MLHTRKFLYGLTAVLTLASACGGDDDDNGTEPTGDTLSEVEFESMVDALEAVGVWQFAGVFGGRGATSDQIAMQSTSIPVDYTDACPVAGTTRVQGTYTFTLNGQTYSYSGNLTQTFANCQATGSGGRTFTFSGAPTITLTASFTGTSYTYSLTQGGAIGWGTGGRSGSCPISLQISGTYNTSGAYSANVSGTMCGRSVNISA